MSKRIEEVHKNTWYKNVWYSRTQFFTIRCKIKGKIHLLKKRKKHTSENSGCIVVLWMQLLWNNVRISSAAARYALRSANLMCTVAIIRSPTNRHTWNSCTASTPLIWILKKTWYAYRIMQSKYMRKFNENRKLLGFFDEAEQDYKRYVTVHSWLTGMFWLAFFTVKEISNCKSIKATIIFELNRIYGS